MRSNRVLAVFTGIVCVALFALWLVRAFDSEAPTLIAKTDVAPPGATSPSANGHRERPDVPNSTRTPVDVVAANGEKTTADSLAKKGLRIVRGQCLDPQGTPLAKGNIRFGSALGNRVRDVDAQVVLGEFTVELPPGISDAGHAIVSVSTELRMVFNGLVRLDDYVVVQVASESDPRLCPSGIVSIDGPAPESWSVAVFSKGGRYVMAAPMKEGGYSGSSETLSLVLYETRMLDAKVPTVCMLTDVSGGRLPGSPIARLEFDSLEEFVLKLRDGLAFETTAHQVAVPSIHAQEPNDNGKDINQLSKIFVFPFADELSIGRAVPLVNSVGTLIISWPGRYGVRATTDVGRELAGEFDVLEDDMGGISIVSWNMMGLGAEKASAQIVDERGNSIVDARCWWRRADLPPRSGYEIWGKVSEVSKGRVDASNLEPGRYVMGAQSANGDRHESAECEVPQDNPTRIALRARGRIILDLRQPLAFADTVDTPRLWLRKSTARRWHEIATEPPSHLPVIRGLEPADYEIAVLAGDLAGSITVNLVGAEARETVPLSVTALVRGRLVPALAEPDRLIVAVRGKQRVLPWEESRVGRDGAFSVRAEQVYPNLILRRRDSGRLLLEWKSTGVDEETVTAPEALIKR